LQYLNCTPYAFQHLHALRIVECDVKAANLLVCKLRAPGCHRVTIADFGCAVQFAAESDGVVRKATGTMMTWAPEMNDLYADYMAGKGVAGSRCTSQIDV
jgi:serine/threonine protein kinase